MVLLEHVTVCLRCVNKTQRSCVVFAAGGFFGGQEDGQLFSLTSGGRSSGKVVSTCMVQWQSALKSQALTILL
jgi:hypothetical protein